MIGEIIGGLGSLVGGILGSNATNNANQVNAQIAREQMAMQREFAQSGIQWRARDADLAGVHPVFAMGAPGASYTPVAANIMPDTSMAQGMAGLGQNIGRAVNAAMTWDERKKAKEMEDVKTALTLNNMGLQNDLLKTQIHRLQVGPAMPNLGASSPGGGLSGDVRTQPLSGQYEMDPHKVTTAATFSPQTAAGPAGPQGRWNLASNGALQLFPPQGLIEDQEITNPLMIRWLASNEGRRPPDHIWKQVFPQADNIRWSVTGLGWVPVRYSGARDPEHGRYEHITPWDRARARSGVVTVPMPR